MAFWQKGPKLGTVVDGKSPAEDSYGDIGIIRNDEQLAIEAHRADQPGELTLAEDTAGGMGRHLGLFSTTFLMYESFVCYANIQKRLFLHGSAASAA